MPEIGPKSAKMSENGPSSDILRMGHFSDIFSLSELKNLENLKMFLTSLRMTFHPRLRPPLTFTTPMPVRICTNPIISQNSILFLYVI